MDKRLLQFLGLCQRASKLASGETGALSAVKDGSAELIIVADSNRQNESGKPCLLVIIIKK